METINQLLLVTYTIQHDIKCVIYSESCTIAILKVIGPCWRFSLTDRFYFGQCDALHRFVPNSDVVVGTPNDEDVFTCKATSEQVTDQVKLDVNLLKT